MIAQEELWQHPGFPGMIVIATNSTVKKDGRLVMDSISASEAKNRIKDIDLECGKRIMEVGPNYGFLIIRQPTAEKIGFGIFQTKHAYNMCAKPELISVSAFKLKHYAMAKPDVSIRMNFPGIGFQNLKKKEVLPYIQTLLSLDNLTICEVKLPHGKGNQGGNQ